MSDDKKSIWDAQACKAAEITADTFLKVDDIEFTDSQKTDHIKQQMSDGDDGRNYVPWLLEKLDERDCRIAKLENDGRFMSDHSGCDCMDCVDIGLALNAANPIANTTTNNKATK